MCEKTEAEALRERLCIQNDHFMKAHGDELAAADAFCDGYKAFLQRAKTERECNKAIIEKAKQRGFVPFDPFGSYKTGDKVYYDNRGKSVILCVFGKKSVSEGLRIAASHIDSPRLDMKPTPLYEDAELAYFKTHYYGGIRKYQWAAIPLSLHGVFVKKDGTVVPVRLGEEKGEPQFVITDLLPHLAKEQSKRTLSEGIQGEELNVVIGSRPFKSDKGSELVKLNILKLLFDKYGVDENDFISAELEAVPAFEVRDIGFDRGLIGGYGHDDRVCAYPAMEALYTLDVPEYTCLTVLADKEEIGSDGNTGLASSFFRYFIEDLADMQGVKARHVLHNSDCLSADVTAGFDPTFSQVFDKTNSSFVSHGVSIAKYTGGRGKGGASDANAEFLGKIRAMLDRANVHWQIGEMGKVDEGGGGTVARFLASLDINVLDLGVPVLSMHAPFELVAKTDVYSTYRACKAFFES